jgi:hypothetical protein
MLAAFTSNEKDKPQHFEKLTKHHRKLTTKCWVGFID